MKSNTVASIVRAGVWGAIAGGVVGFAVGLLLAPEEGQRFRRRLAYQLEKLAGRVGDLVDEISGVEGGSTARRKADRFMEDAQEEAQRIRADIDAILGDARGKAASESPE